MIVKNPNHTAIRMRLSRIPSASLTSTMPSVGPTIYSMAPRMMTKKIPMPQRYPPRAVTVNTNRMEA